MCLITSVVTVQRESGARSGAGLRALVSGRQPSSLAVLIDGVSLQRAVSSAVARELGDVVDVCLTGRPTDCLPAAYGLAVWKPQAHLVYEQGLCFLSSVLPGAMHIRKGVKWSLNVIVLRVFPYRRTSES